MTSNHVALTSCKTLVTWVKDVNSLTHTRTHAQHTRPQTHTNTHGNPIRARIPTHTYLSFSIYITDWSYKTKMSLAKKLLGGAVAAGGVVLAIKSSPFASQPNVEPIARQAYKKFNSGKDFPDLSQHNNCMAKVLDRDLYAKLRDLVSSIAVLSYFRLQIHFFNCRAFPGVSSRESIKRSSI